MLTVVVLASDAASSHYNAFDLTPIRVMLPMQLANPPIVEHLLLENPWPVGLTCAAAAIGALWLGRQRMQAKLKVAGLVLLLVAATVFVVANLVTTSREHITVATRALIQSTAPLDLSTFRSHLHSSAVLQGPQGEPWIHGDKIFEGLERAVKRFPFEGQVVLSLEAEAGNEGPARTLVDIRTDTKTNPVVTRWLLSWVKQNDGRWQVVSVQWLDSPHLLGFKPQRAWVPVN